MLPGLAATRGKGEDWRCAPGASGARDFAAQHAYRRQCHAETVKKEAGAPERKLCQLAKKSPMAIVVEAWTAHAIFASIELGPMLP